MDRIRSAKKQTNNRFLNMYELEVAHRDGKISPYYMASRVEDPRQIKAVTKVNTPNGVIMYGVYGDEKDKVVLVRQYRYPIGGYVYEFLVGCESVVAEMVDVNNGVFVTRADFYKPFKKLYVNVKRHMVVASALNKH